nr:response regulator [bacterium]
DRRALEGEGVIVDEERVGEQVYEIRKFPLSLGDGIKGVGGLIRDVTENRRTLEELKQTTEELNRYFSTALDLFCIADAEGSFRRLNQRWEEVLGLPLKEIGGRRLLDFVHPEDREKTVEALRRLREGKPLTNFLNRYRHRDGSYRHIEWRAIPEGPLIYAAARDVSDRVRGEEERAGIEARLRQAQKMEAIGNLAGGIAHDFNNMLNVIINYADLALSDPGLSREIRQDLKEIKKAGEHSADLTRQLLAFSRKQIISPRAVDLNAAVAENMDMLRRLIGEDIEITFKPGAGIGTIWIDPSQVVQILTNLAANARDAIAGTGIISIETAAVAWERGREPAGSGRNLEEYVSLVFTDSGTGIDPDKTDRIFEPFFTTKEVGKGTGLGLATVYGIVAQNGGSIEVTTAAGRGASFIISFPRYRGETGGGGCEKTPAAEGTGETILLVEDDPRVLSITEKMLQRCGYEVLSAGTAERACELAGAERKIDLLLTDVVMPTTNGKQLRRRIETLKPGIKTVFMSGYTADVIAERGVLNRSVAFISKPFSVRELRAKIREVLDS